MRRLPRCRRWKTYIKSQQSEEQLYQRLRGIHNQSDKRTLVLAYGSWGAVAGRPGLVANRGNTPCIGVGLMNTPYFTVCVFTVVKVKQTLV